MVWSWLRCLIFDYGTIWFRHKTDFTLFSLTITLILKDPKRGWVEHRTISWGTVKTDRCLVESGWCWVKVTDADAIIGRFDSKMGSSYSDLVYKNGRSRACFKGVVLRIPMSDLWVRVQTKSRLMSCRHTIGIHRSDHNWWFPVTRNHITTVWNDQWWNTEPCH